ncbi:hypothetical protein J6590_041970 [Homalodisca vitripennis]|nr:hypothetical protein J6590_041970 [Homalodisca vitripennis]
MTKSWSQSVAMHLIASTIAPVPYVHGMILLNILNLSFGRHAPDRKHHSTCTVCVWGDPIDCASRSIQTRPSPGAHDHSRTFTQFYQPL